MLILGHVVEEGGGFGGGHGNGCRGSTYAAPVCGTTGGWCSGSCGFLAKTIERRLKKFTVVSFHLESQEKTHMCWN